MTELTKDKLDEMFRRFQEADKEDLKRCPQYVLICGRFERCVSPKNHAGDHEANSEFVGWFRWGDSE